MQNYDKLNILQFKTTSVRHRSQKYHLKTISNNVLGVTNGVINFNLMMSKRYYWNRFVHIAETM